MVADLAVLYVGVEQEAEKEKEDEEERGGEGGVRRRINPLLATVQRQLLAALARVRGQVLVISPQQILSTARHRQHDYPTTRPTEVQEQDHKQKLVIDDAHLPLPTGMYEALATCTAIGFPASALLDESRVLKERSHFAACSLRPPAAGASREPSLLHHASSSASSPLLPWSGPSTATFSFNNGINLATLSNVCLADNKKEFYLIKDQKADNILSSELRDILKQSSSGFYPFDAEGGWLFSEVTAEELSLSVSTATAEPSLSFYPGVTAVSSPAFAPQMIHTAQTLFPLLQAGMHPKLYPWINHLER